MQLLVNAQRSVVRVLRACGAEVTTADSVDEAYRVIEAQPFDAAIVDYHLVDQTGLSIIAKLRSGQRPCCALMITGDVYHHERGVEAIAAGADDFLIKPFIIEDLITAVAKTIQQTRQWRARLTKTQGKGQEGGAGDVLRDPEGIDQIGLPNYRACVDELVRLGNLSMRERQVLEQILLGKKNREAGAAIGVTERTVKYHMAGILKKIGVRSRNELVRMLFNARNPDRDPPN
jgi:DNA-binding NarL/FixJ family response regulator